MDLVMYYKKELQTLEEIVIEKNLHKIPDYTKIEAYFTIIRKGIHALEYSTYSKEELKVLQINTIESNFKILKELLK